MRLSQEAHAKAIEVLSHCINPSGLYASGTPEGYTSVWSRDSMISLLGGALLGDRFQSVFRRSLLTLAKNQSEHGQIPNAVGLYDELRKSDVTYNTIDSTFWFLIGARVYQKAYKDARLLKRLQTSIEKAFLWIEMRDISEDILPEQLPTTDWQDAFPHKYGHTINSAALYYGALRLHGRRAKAEELKRLVNGNSKFPHLALYDKKRGYYLPWAWKDHAGDREEEYWFDSLGNCLAIITGLASRETARRILHHIEKQKINRPYPVKTIYPPFQPGKAAWHSYFNALGENRLPFQYLNGGIWPMNGGFYVAALVKAKQHKKAAAELELLAEANRVGKDREWEFNEWLDGKTGKPKGGIWQAWSAGAYLLAYESVRRKKVSFFR